MTHDHRCPSLRYVVLGGRVCVCGIVEDIRRDTLAAAVQRVESIPDAHWVNPNRIAAAGNKAQVIAAIKGEA